MPARPPFSIALATSSVTIDEDAGTAQIDVVRSNGSDGQVTVDYDTELGTADPGNDYTPVSGTLVFEDGETVQTIVIPILDDGLVEPIEQFGVTIDNVNGGATLLVPRTATVTIVDDEVALPNYPDFSSTTELTLNGTAATSGNSIALTSGSNNQAGSFFYDQAISSASDASFRSSFSR